MTPPPRGTVERWAYDYVASTDLATKLAPPPAPREWEDAPPPRRLEAPGRPPELTVAAKGLRTPKEVTDPRARAGLLHTFLHHELQAAELMAWAILAFPGAPRPFKRGLVTILEDEVRHMGLYAEHLAALGLRFGALPVNDWFWLRVPRAETAISFVATMGLGFEGGNLDHASRFAARFREAGDLRGAALQERVAEEEISHVRFAARWFRAWTGELDFDAWKRELVPPLTPTVMRGAPLDRGARLRAGMPAPFIDAVESWSAPCGSRGS